MGVSMMRTTTMVSFREIPLLYPSCPSCGRALRFARTVPATEGLAQLQTFTCRECSLWITESADGASYVGISPKARSQLFGLARSYVLNGERLPPSALVPFVCAEGREDMPLEVFRPLPYPRLISNDSLKIGAWGNDRPSEITRDRILKTAVRLYRRARL